MNPEDYNFNANNEPATPDELQDAMEDVNHTFAIAYEMAADRGEDILEYQLSHDQLEGTALGARCEHVDVAYEFSEDHENPGFDTVEANFLLTRRPVEESPGFTQVITLMHRFSPETNSYEASGYVQLFANSVAAEDMPSEPSDKAPYTMEEMLELPRQTDFSDVPYTEPGRVTREDLANIAEAAALLRANYPELGSSNPEQGR